MSANCPVRRAAAVVVVTLTIALPACRGRSSKAPDAIASARATGGSVSNAAGSNSDDGQWLMPAKNYAGTRFTQLDEINTSNVSQLNVVWTFSTGMVAGHE